MCFPAFFIEDYLIEEGENMLDAKQIIRIMEQLETTPTAGREIQSLDDVDVGATVMFKKGTTLEGVVGLVLNKREPNSVDLKIGKATKVDIPISDLLLV